MTGVVADPQMWSGSVSWSGMGGRLRVGAAYDAHKDFTTPGQTDKGFRVTGGWNFGFADIGAAYEEMVYKTAAGDVDALQWGVALAVPIGQGAIRGSYSQAEGLEAAGVETPTGAKQWNLGYDYRFSKRTTVGFGYATIDNESRRSLHVERLVEHAGRPVDQSARRALMWRSSSSTCCIVSRRNRQLHETGAFGRPFFLR